MMRYYQKPKKSCTNALRQEHMLGHFVKEVSVAGGGSEGNGAVNEVGRPVGYPLEGSQESGVALEWEGKPCPCEKHGSY